MKRPAGVILTALALSACGGSSSPTSSPGVQSPGATTGAGPTVAQMRATYLRLVAPANAKIKPFFDSVKDTDTGPQVAAKAKPLLTAFRTLDEALLRARWTPQVATDVRALVSDDRVFEATLADAASQSGFSASSWEQTLTTALGKVSGDVSIVRADLGLPPK